MSGTEENVDYTNRSNDPLRVFLTSSKATKTGTHHYRFFLNLDASYDTYDIYFQLRQLQVAYSFYQINSTNNILSLNDEEYTIPPGNYSATELVELLNDHGTWNALDIAFTLNANTGKVTLSADSEFSWGLATTANKLLGYTVIPSGSYSSFTSNRVVDVSPIKALNFHLISVPSRSFAIYDSQEISRHIATIFIGDAQPFTTLSWTDDSGFSESTLQNTLRTLEVTVYDQNGIPVELQNGTFQMLLEFTFRPKKVWRLFYSPLDI